MTSFVQFMALQSAQEGEELAPIDDADPQLISIHNALQQFAALLKSEFVVYLP